MSDQTPNTTDRSFDLRRTAKITVWVVMIVAIGLFALVNTHDVAVDWVAGETQTALWIVIAITAVSGFVVGYVTSLRRR